MGGSGAAGLGPLCSLVPDLLRSLAPRALTCFFPHPLRLGRFFSSSLLAHMGGARRADLAGGSVYPPKVGEAFRTATPRRGGGAEKVTLLVVKERSCANGESLENT